jgi:glycosyltransferase involved in cell wall biosynthesis
MSASPCVTVVVTTYNRPAMLAEALESVAAQTFRDFELIVVNDAGEDVSAIVNRFDHFDITHIRHAQNKGHAGARNTAIRQARGRYMAFLDDDDIFYPDHLERLVACAMAHPDAAIVYADSVQAYQTQIDGRWVVERRLLRHSVPYDPTRLLIDNHIAVLCALVRCDVFAAVGAFDESLPVYEDWDLWLRASRRFSFIHLPQVTSEYRLRQSPDRTSVRARQQFLPYRLRLWRRYSFFPWTLVLASAYFAKRVLLRFTVPTARREAAMAYPPGEDGHRPG